MKHNTAMVGRENKSGLILSVKRHGNPAAFLIALFAAAILFSSCATMAPFSQVELDKITALKAESLALMSKATSSFAASKSSVDALKASLESAHSASDGREKNKSAAKQWAILKDPTANLLGGFLARWENKGTLSDTFVAEASGNISKAFDQLIELESGRSR